MKRLQNIFSCEGLRVDYRTQISLRQLKCKICKRQVEAYTTRVKFLCKLIYWRNPADDVGFTGQFFKNLRFSLKASNSVRCIWREGPKGIVKLQSDVLVSDFVESSK